jgi:hypothetical protein
MTKCKSNFFNQTAKQIFNGHEVLYIAPRRTRSPSGSPTFVGRQLVLVDPIRLNFL